MPQVSWEGLGGTQDSSLPASLEGRITLLPWPLAVWSCFSGPAGVGGQLSDVQTRVQPSKWSGISLWGPREKAQPVWDLCDSDAAEK